MNGLLFYISAAWGYAVEMLPCAAVGAIGFFCLRPWRKKRLAGMGVKSGFGREGMMLLLVLFTAGLSALTLFPPRFWRWPIFPLYSREYSGIGSFYWGIDIWSDLVEGFQNLKALGWSWSHFLLLGNIIMFMPFGFFPALIGDKPRWWKALLTGLFTSTLIEVVQLFIDRSSDINDIILNTTGALCGFWVYLLVKRLAPNFTARFKLQKTEVPYGRDAGTATAP